MKALKILMLGWEYAPVISGGLGIVCRALTDSLVRKGMAVTFVVPKLPGNVKIEQANLVDASIVSLDDLKNSLKIHSVTTLLTPYLAYGDYANLWNLRKHAGKLDLEYEIYGPNLFEEMKAYSLRVIKIAAFGTFDVIHAHDWMTFDAGIKLKKLFNIPLIVHVHSTEYDRTGNNPNSAIREFELRGLLAADKIIALSEFNKNKIVEHYGIDPKKIVIVHNAIEKEGQNFSETAEKFTNSEKMVLFLARLSVQKGGDYLLRAAQKVLNAMPNIRFVFVGKGNMLEQLINLSIDLGISDKVTFAGALNHDQVDKMYRNADLFVMPSTSEPFGITTLEAIKNGAPVLISKQSGVSEVLKNALKVDFWDIDEMANKILAVLGHESLQETLVENGYHDLEKLNWDTQADLVIEQYNALKK
ncbi:MAG TPA: glycosyltransferase family 4 protein [Candidatus Dojkabacteria bacterium]|nr:glycosyltransferase family 4 protein [Candidatus Dojkabacteria bacterium]